MSVYRGYTADGLDAQYNLRKNVPDAAVHVARREAASAEIRATVPCRLDIAYGAGEAETFDLFPPDRKESAAPVLIYIHGGYWYLSDKFDTSYVAPAFTAAGIAFVSLNYALAPAAGIEEMVDQIRGAIAYIWRNAEDLGIDRDRICVAGHSAGGHLTMMAAATDWRAFGLDLPADPVKAACGISGLYDLEPVRLCYVNEVLGLDAPTARRNSPVLHKPAMTGPILLAAGTDETDEFRRHSTTLAHRWRSEGADITKMEVLGAHHYTIVHALADQSSALFRAVTGLVTGTGAGENDEH